MEEAADSAAPCCRLCGACASCVFGPEPPGSVRRAWTSADADRRRLIVGLILRCSGVKVLRCVQEGLRFTSWTSFNYGRSQRPSRDQTNPSGIRSRGSEGETLGLDVAGIWEWFSRSSDLTQSRFLLRLFSFCDSELLRMVANLSRVLLDRRERGILPGHVAGESPGVLGEDLKNPALVVVPGSSESLSGVSRYCDFISCLPGHLSKRILGLLDGRTLRRCQKVCPTWRHLARETLGDFKIRKSIQEQFAAMKKKYSRIKTVSHTYASFVEVPVPLKDGEGADPRLQEVDIFHSAYAQVPTRRLRMEERNVHCGTYFTTVLLHKEDPHRVVDFRDGPLLALGSKDRALQLFYVASELKSLKVLKGHSGSVRAVLLCQDRDLVITGSRDSSIRCWNLKTGECWAILYGHCEVVNCLDLHGDRLVSGAKDHLVRVWSLETQKRIMKYNFKHPAAVQCVKISSTCVCSSCDWGLVRVWDLDTTLMLRVIDAHQSSVRCLFLDDLHLVSADLDGQVMAWSANNDVKQCLVTFTHPQEVKSLALVFLRLLTGCVDGKIRVFNFLTGACLREITAEAPTVGILSVHFFNDGLLVNSKSRISRLQFAKVFWDYAEGSQADAAEKPAGSLGKFSDHREKMTPVCKNMEEGNVKKSAESKQFHQSCILPSSTEHQVQGKGSSGAPSALPSEKGLNEKKKKRVPHQPLTGTSTLHKGQ